MPAPAVTRELSIIYGATTIGGTSDWAIEGYSVSPRGYARSVVTARVIGSGFAPQAAFITACQALETAFRTPRQRLRILGSGAAVILDLDPTTGVNTGYLASSTIRQVDDLSNTLRSRRYEITIEVQEPADLAGQGGRRDSRIEEGFSPGRRREVTISGTYTSLGATDSARAVYNANIAAYRTIVLAARGGEAAYDLYEESVTADDNDRNCDFRNRFREIIHDQAAGGVGDADITDQILLVGRSREAPGDSIVGDQTPSRLQSVRILYQAEVNNTTVADLRTKWLAVRPYVLSRARTASGLTGQIATVSEDVRLDHDRSRIDATLELRGVAEGTLISALETIATDEVLGVALVPVWDESPLAKHVFRGIGNKSMRRTIVRTDIAGGGVGGGGGRVRGVAVGGGDGAGIFAGNLGPVGDFGAAPGVAFGFGGVAQIAVGVRQAIAGEDNWVLVRRSKPSRQERRMGFTGESIDVIDTTTVEEFEMAVPPSQSAAGAVAGGGAGAAGGAPVGAGVADAAAAGALE